MSKKKDTGRKIELRFYQSGTLDWIKIKKGDKVKRGQSLAGLDTRLVKINLDIALADYRRVRAEFDKTARKYPHPSNEEEKGIKEIAQAKLDSAVKKVEKYKYLQDKLTLISPVDGVVKDDSNLVAGMNITPSGFPIKIKEESTEKTIPESKDKKEVGQKDQKQKTKP